MNGMSIEPDIDLTPPDPAAGNGLTRINGAACTTVGPAAAAEVNADSEQGSNTERQQKTTSPWNLFRFATWFDVLCIVLGFVAAVLAGSCLPLIFLILGLVINEFTGYTVINETVSGSIGNNSRLYFCNVSELYPEYFASNALEYLLRERIFTLTYYCIAVAVLLFVSSFASNILWSVSALRQARRMRRAFLKAILRQDVGYYDVNPPVELPTRLADNIQKIEDGIGYNFANFIQEFSGLFAGLIIALSLNWRLALVTSVFLPLLLLIIVLMAKVSIYVSGRELAILAEAGGVAEEVLSAIRTVMAFGGEKREIERYSGLLKKAKLESYKKQLTVAFIYGSYTLVFFAFYSLGIWYGGELLTECRITGGTIVTVVIEIAGISFNLGNALPLLLSITDAVAAAAGIYPIIDQVPDQKKRTKVLSLEDLEGDIHFSDVTFSYPSRPDKPVLRGVSCHIRPGQTVGLVGPSGCGKTTILQLLQRLYTENRGLITIDGVDIKELSIGWLRSQIGVVSQEPLLFNVTIAENIGYGKEGATTEDIEDAAKDANAYTFITQLPDGFNTLVGDGGAQLSGGQKQRIAIARALIRNPKILLLDEATSALDAENESIVQEALDKARVGRTTIVIAHRLSTVQAADLILVMDKGVIAEVGTHADLLEKEGLYHELVQNQMSDVDHFNEAATRDFAIAYRQGVKRRVSMKQRIPSTSGRQAAAQASAVGNAPTLTNTITRTRRLSAKQMIKEGSTLNVPRRYNNPVTAGGGGQLLPAVSEISIPPPTPKTPKYSPHNLFELDDVFEDDPDMPQQTQPVVIQKAPWKEMLGLSKPDWLLLVTGLVGFVLFGLLLSTLYVLFSEAIEVFSETDRDELLRKVSIYSALYAVIGFVGFVINFLATYFLSIAADRLTTRLREKSFETIMKQDLTFFDEPHNSTSILTGRLAVDTSEVNQATGLALGLSVRGIVNLLANYIIIFQASWAMGLTSLVTVIIFLLGGFLQLSLTNLFILKSLEHQGRSLKTAIEAIENIYTIISLGIDRRILKKYKDQLKPAFNYDVQGSIIQSLLFALTQSCSMFILAGAFPIAAYIYTASSTAPYHANLSEVFRAIGAMLYTGWLFKELFRSLPDTQSAQIAASRILSLLNEKPEISLEGGVNLTFEEQYAKLKLNNVHFSYPSRPGVSVLPGLSLTVKPAKTLALVGPSGSGKSTIIALAERFYGISGGSIEINNLDIGILNLSVLRRQLSLVSQEPVLFDMSVADNIRYGVLFRDDVSEDEIIEAAKCANIHDFIMTLPKGYATLVGNKGAQLSGGEKQRIAIARALIRNPKILLLDEATSALDAENESIVQEALDKARMGRTTIVIAHRLSTVHHVDSIAVLHEGRIVEQGTHDELMRKKGHYYLMNNISQRESNH